MAQWKLSPVDVKAQKLWDDYTKARDRMFEATHSEIAPWTVVRADDKHQARLNLIRDLLSRLDYGHRDDRLVTPDRRIVFPYERGMEGGGMRAR